MFVKYQVVRNLLIAVVVIGGGVWIYGQVTAPDPPPPEAKKPAPATPTTPPGSEPVSPAVGQPLSADGEPARAHEEPATRVPPSAEWAPVLEVLHRPASGKKIKDLLGSRKAKVNVYDDDGDGRWDRVKIDTDRDGEPDEKWTVKDGVIERREAGSDRVLIWSGSSWDSKTARPTPPREIVAGDVAAATDDVVTALRGRAPSKKVKDAWGAGRPKLNLYDDDQDGQWDRAKLDRDRDGEWDEKYTVKNGAIERKVVASGAVSVWTDIGWASK